MANGITQDSIEVAKAQAAEAIIRNNTTDSAYLSRWGNSRYLGFFFAPDDAAAERYRARVQDTERKRYRIVGKVTPEEARSMSNVPV